MNDIYYQHNNKTVCSEQNAKTNLSSGECCYLGVVFELFSLHQEMSCEGLVKLVNLSNTFRALNKWKVKKTRRKFNG